MAGRASPDTRIRPVILSGGTGTRLWPLSRALYPKQLMPLTSELSMLQETVHRVSDPERFASPLVLCHEEHRFIVAEQFRELGVSPRAIVLEPEGRNTAPAAAVAALTVMEQDGDCLLLLLPSDHVIGDTKAFLTAVDKAKKAAASGALVAFGIAPQRPETGYGYIKQGKAIKKAPGCYRIARFVEKPDRAEAERLIADGDCHWNSGMFLFGAKRYIEELDRLRSDIVAACREAVVDGRKDLEFNRLQEEAFTRSPASSIDYAVMEHTAAAAVVPADMKWNDLGSWATLWEIGDKDSDGNVTSGDVVVKGARNSYLRGDGHLLAAIGLEDVIIVATDDVVLAVSKDRAQEVRGLVDDLKAAGREEASSHVTVYRPWGSWRTLRVGDRFQVKQITVKPGQMLSLQMHHHRAEHWIVVNGTARVTRGDETILLSENESTYVPLGVTHRIENPGQVPLNLIEVQSGEYLGEDDIVRFEDTYGRA
jgi:mannose-1-phosphate guanylyltransferase/mannose-6-phosphate isomerase